MLTKMLPEQVATFWDIIRYAIEQSLPPISHDHPDRMARILSSALSGEVDVWASYNRNNGATRFEGIVLTKVLYDDISDTRNLLIYCIYGYGPVDKLSWLHAINSIVKYAKFKGCSQIVAYTEFPGIVEKAKRLGANASYHFISFDVDKASQNLDSREWR